MISMNNNEELMSCYELNKKIIDYVNKNKLIDECLKYFNIDEKNSRESDQENNLSLEILNFPNILETTTKDKDKVNKTLIQRMIKYLEISKFFDEKKKPIKEGFKEKKIVKKIFDFVLKNALKKGLNSVDYYSNKDKNISRKLQGYIIKDNDDEKQYIKNSDIKIIKEENFFSNDLKTYIKEFKKGFKRCMTFFELEGEPNQKMKYLEEAYDIVKNVYELNASSATFDIQTIILLWKYFIMSSHTKKLFSSFLILHLFIRKDLLSITQVEILFAIKEVINDLFNLNIDQFINMDQ